MNTPAIYTKSLHKQFNETTALRSLDLSVRSGEIYAYLGPNGAGKTTTIKLLSGLLRPTNGSMSVKGVDVVDNPVQIRDMIAYVPDQPYIYDKLTGREFLHFVGNLYDVPSDKIEDRVQKYSDLFETHDFLDSLGETYSHGMKQRVVLSATFLHDPEVILIDEPLVGLDPKSSRKVRYLFREKAHEEDITVFMSTHVLSIAEEIADRIGVITDGELIAEGTMEELQKEDSPAQNLEDLFLEITEQQVPAAG